MTLGLQNNGGDDETITGTGEVSFTFDTALAVCSSYEVTVKTERIKHWMENGATPTATVKTILKKKGFFTVSP